MFRNTTFPDEKYLKELMDNYDGDITKVITQKDGLDYLVKHTDHLTCGDVLRINNGQGHAMENFLEKRTTWNNRRTNVSKRISRCKWQSI